MSYSHCHSGNSISCQFTTSVKPKPTNPQHGSAHQGITEVVWWHVCGRIPFALAKNDRCHQTSHAGVDMDNCAPSKIENTFVSEPATAAPYPMTDRCVYDCHPDRHEDEHSRELHALSEGSYYQGRSDHGKCHLECHENSFWNGSAECVDTNTFKKYFT